MKITLDLPDELIRELKLRAVIQRRTVKVLVAEFIREGLGIALTCQPQAHAVGPLVQLSEGGLPKVLCPADAPATRMSVEQLLMIEHDTQSVKDLKDVGISV